MPPSLGGFSIRTLDITDIYIYRLVYPLFYPLREGLCEDNRILVNRMTAKKSMYCWNNETFRRHEETCGNMLDLIQIPPSAPNPPFHLLLKRWIFSICGLRFWMEKHFQFHNHRYDLKQYFSEKYHTAVSHESHDRITHALRSAQNQCARR